MDAVVAVCMLFCYTFVYKNYVNEMLNGCRQLFHRGTCAPVKCVGEGASAAGQATAQRRGQNAARKELSW